MRGSASRGLQALELHQTTEGPRDDPSQAVVAEKAAGQEGDERRRGGWWDGSEEHDHKAGATVIVRMHANECHATQFGYRFKV